MKLRTKVGKLTQPLTYRRASRRFQRILHPIRLEPLLRSIDEERLQQLQVDFRKKSPQATSCWPDYAKYLRVEEFLAMNVRRVQDLNLHRTPPCDILDIGCGAGYFLFAAQTQGHRGLGLDLAGIPVFDAMVALLGVQRKISAVTAFKPLPDLGRRFDLITSFSTNFHGRRGHDWYWGSKKWEFFINDLRAHLKPGGRIFFGLNANYGKNFYSPEMREVFARHGAIVERENVLFPPQGSTSSRFRIKPRFLLEQAPSRAWG